MEIFLLASGSSGNCALLRGGRGDALTTLVLDCGIALRSARDLASSAGVELGRADAVLLTHHHADHVFNVVPVAARARAPLYAHPQALAHHPRTSAGERQRRRIDDRPYASGQTFAAGAFHCTPILLPHDAAPTHGFLFEADGQRAGFFTDLGTAELLADGCLDGLDFLILEFNHDREMLRHGPYPPHLQERVAGPYGHLSNDQAARLLAEAAPRGLRRLVLAHLSRKNNSEFLAMQAAEWGLRNRSIRGLIPEIAPTRGLLRVAAE